MVFNATVKNISVISWQSVLCVEETGVHGENQIHIAYHNMLNPYSCFSVDMLY